MSYIQLRKKPRQQLRICWTNDPNDISDKMVWGWYWPSVEQEDAPTTVPSAGVSLLGLGAQVWLEDVDAQFIVDFLALARRCEAETIDIVEL